jgi:hypothetical protein
MVTPTVSCRLYICQRENKIQVWGDVCTDASSVKTVYLSNCQRTGFLLRKYAKGDGIRWKTPKNGQNVFALSSFIWRQYIIKYLNHIQKIYHGCLPLPNIYHRASNERSQGNLSATTKETSFQYIIAMALQQGVVWSLASLKSNRWLW